jgi:hypothetical protein
VLRDRFQLIIQSLAVLLMLAFFTQNSLALEQNTGQWFALNIQQPFVANKEWLYSFFSQLRFIDQAHPWRYAILEGALGHQLPVDSHIWLGYRWSGINPYNAFFQENRLFEQIILQRHIQQYRFISRTRLEEISHSNANQIALRFRQRLAVEINYALFKNTFPFFSDEVFFQLNHPPYEPQSVIGQNRLFLGFNFYCTKKSWWEIGYLNQYQVKSPQKLQNQMSHILSFTYNFI